MSSFDDYKKFPTSKKGLGFMATPTLALLLSICQVKGHQNLVDHSGGSLCSVAESILIVKGLDTDEAMMT